jgi:hypothetical protein
MRPLRTPSAALAGVLLSAAVAAASTPKAYLSKERVGDKCWFNPTTTAEATLGCWLLEHPKVAQAMIYWDSTYTDGSGWSTWPLTSKHQLRSYFGKLVTWYHAGMPSKN